MRFSEPSAEEDVAGAARTRSTSSTPPARPARGPCCATPAARSGSPTPGRGGEDAVAAPRRRALADAGRRRRARGRRRARARLRAGLPPPHVDLRRGRPGDRALPRGHRRRAAARLRPPARGRRRSGAGARATGASASARSTSRTCGSTCSRQVKAERADTLTAWRRGLFCALGQGDVDLDGFCAALTSAATTAGSSSSRTACSTTSTAFEGAAHEQVANRDWLREHAGW